MTKIIKYNVSIAIVFCLLFSTVGFTAISIACPNMNAQPGVPCSQCKSGTIPKKHAPDCCKTKIEHKVIKSEFEKPLSFKANIVVEQVFAPSFLQLDYSKVLLTPILYRTPHSFAMQSSVEKCALLSTFLI